MFCCDAFSAFVGLSDNLATISQLLAYGLHQTTPQWVYSFAPPVQRMRWCHMGADVPNNDLHVVAQSTSRKRSSRYDASISLKLSQAEAQGCCYSPQDGNERRRLDRRVRSGELVRPAPSSFVRKELWDSMNPCQRHVMLARTMARANPNWVFCGFSAAAIMGFQVPYSSLDHLHRMVYEAFEHRNSAIAQVHRSIGTTSVVHDGILVTPPEQTARECMIQLDFARALAVADSATRVCGWNDLHLLEDILQNPNSTSRQGSTTATCAALLADSRSESGGESIARANMIMQGIVLPELQLSINPNAAHPVCDRGQSYNGGYRIDFGWQIPGRGLVAGELDGRQKYEAQTTGPNQDEKDVLLAERRREAQLTLVCDAIVRFSFVEARNPWTLTSILGDYNVPHACEPLKLTGPSEHCQQEILQYLQESTFMSKSARVRLDALDWLGIAPKA